jgi:hypothetical protein
LSKQLAVLADERLGISMADYVSGTLGGREEYAATRVIGHVIRSEIGAALFKGSGLESGSTT